MERKLFTALQGDTAEALNDALSKQGFRRSQNVLYRPACSECNACLSARIRVEDFTPTRSQKRTIKKNADLYRRTTSPWATDEQYDLFRTYLDSRHAEGGMADMDMFEYAAMIEETPIRSRVMEYYALDKANGNDPLLKAVCLTDVLDDGLSMVYSFFDPEMTKTSLGTYLILDHIQHARELNLPYVYLGYWVPGSDKMGYKAKFDALEIFHQGEWKPLNDPSEYDSTMHPLAAEPIAEQVSKIRLPDTRRFR